MPETTTATTLDLSLSAPLRFLPEGPFPLGDGQFSWVGIQHGATATAGSVNVCDMNSGENRSFDLPGRPGFAFPTQQADTFVVGCERSLGYFNTQDRSWHVFQDGVDGDVENTIINDGMMYRDNLIFGTKDLEFKTTKAGLYLFRGRDQKLIRLRSDQLCSNGKAVIGGDEDHVTFIDIDSPTRKIVRYELDIATGELSSAQTVIDLTDDPGVPDGQILTPDRKSLIVAIFHPGVAEKGETRQYDIASGELQHTWITPGSPQNTCPNLVRNSGGVYLVITTAIENFSTAEQKQCPGAGKLFVAPTAFESLGVEADDRFPII